MSRPHRPVEHYQAVAAVWLKGWKQTGGLTTGAVADHWGVPYTTAARWVKRARELGVLTQPFKRTHICPVCGQRMECSRGEF